MATTEEQTLECPKCGRNFDNARAYAGHASWCGKDTLERRLKISATLMGHTHSPETRAKISAAASNPSAETREKMSAAGKNRPPMSDKTRAKLSAAATGMKHSAEARAKIAAAQTGRKHTAETKAKMSAARKGKYVGSKSPYWKGGKFPYGLGWHEQRAMARRRDNDTCQLCGITKEELGHELSAHHIRPLRESADHSIENLICLCDRNGQGSCHGHAEQFPADCPEPRKAWLLTA